MFKYYKESLKFFSSTKIILVLLLIYEAVVFPMKLFPRVTGVAYFFIALFFAAGVLGMLQNRDEYLPGMKALLKQGSRHFSLIILNMAEIFFISFIDLLVIIFFAIMPMIMLGVFPKESDSQRMLIMMFGMVVIYRLPLFIMGFFTPIVDNKDFGRFAVVKLKEIFWNRKKFWGIILMQGILYVIVFLVQLYFFSGKNAIVEFNGIVRMYLDFLFDYFKSFLFLFFIVADYLYYKDIVNGEKTFQERYDRISYTGQYKGIIGRFIM